MSRKVLEQVDSFQLLAPIPLNTQAVPLRAAALICNFGITE